MNNKNTNNVTIEELHKKIKVLEDENKSLQKLVYHDTLTNVYNRAWFLHNIKSHSKVHLTIVDLNKLKLINDSEGHLAGDRFILNVSKKLQDYGKVVRFGGDEFIVISPNQKKFDELNNHSSTLFSKGGVMPDEYQTISEALQIADRRLYVDKRSLEMQSDRSND